MQYFQERVKLWFNTVGKEVFEITNYWARYEFAPGRGQIHAHVLCISSNKELEALRFYRNEGAAPELGAHMREKLGFTADLPPSPPGVERPRPSMAPMNMFFSSVEATELRRDEEELLQCCQVHQCIVFALLRVAYCGVSAAACFTYDTTGAVPEILMLLAREKR